VDNAALLPREGADGGRPRALDVACGSGRHALWLAAAGFDVRAVDRDAGAVDSLGREARRLELTVATSVEDLEHDGAALGWEQYDLIVVFRYLHRPLFPKIRDALRPSGVLVYETFTTAQAARGQPSNPAFLLRPGELADLVAPLRVLRQREGDFEGGMVAGVVARKERST
jgi:SAM-dependent methyltransferase